MSVISYLSLLIIILSIFAQIFKTADASATANNATTNDTNFTFLITGGYRPVEHTLTKYLVSIRLRSQRKYFGDNHVCGGCIIGRSIILTAAHCLTLGPKGKPRDVGTVHVVAKTANRLVETNNTLILGVQVIRIHPSFEPRTLTNDIAIAKLNQGISMDGRLAAIIPLANSPAKPGTHCAIVGWGRLLENGPMLADAAYADLDINADWKCMSYPIFSDGMLCASNLNDPELDSCTGDSGGPLICQFRLVGLVSSGIGCGAGVSGIYTDVWYYRKWIEENRSCYHAGSSNLIVLCALILFNKILMN